MSIISTDREYNMRWFSTELAIHLGIDEAIFISQLEYLISISTAPEHEGHWWTYQTMADLHKNSFPFWSLSKLWRIKSRLVDMGYVLQGRFNQLQYTDERGKVYRDRTNWYALNLEKFNTIHENIFTIGDRVEKRNKSYMSE